jgi:two-component system sensor histidine kinase KdpD
VVLGFIEPHGRAETTALVAGLEQVPRRRVEYRGVAVEEMDLEAILARKPQVVVVDEIPHTNVPGSKNPKRWQDVLELLAAGINVIGALNIQHLESLNDVVSRAAEVHVRETVPDSFLRHADQIVNIDLAVEDLQERLRAGKIYAPDKVARALDHFFQAGNLSTLRELALREVAESLDRGNGASRVMVALSSNPPHAAALLRRGSRLAGRLSSDWFVVHVETPGESPTRIDAEAQRMLLANTEKARELGAEVIRLKARDPVAALLDFARAHGVGHIVIGRSLESRWKQLLRPSVPTRLVREATGFDVHLVSLERGNGGERGEGGEP